MGRVLERRGRLDSVGDIAALRQRQMQMQRQRQRYSTYYVAHTHTALSPFFLCASMISLAAVLPLSIATAEGIR
jgi:hypothetical protein